MTNVTVAQIDKHVEFLRNQEATLRKMEQRWADLRADHFKPIIELLVEMRRRKQMEGMNGEPIGDYPPIKSAHPHGGVAGSGSAVRADQAALDAVPELAGQKALVLYFPTDQDRDDFAAFVKGAMNGVRTVSL